MEWSIQRNQECCAGKDTFERTGGVTATGIRSIESVNGTGARREL